MCLRRLRPCGRSSPHGSSPPLPESPTISASQKNWPRTPWCLRAKKTLSEAHVTFETPSGDELRRRVESVLLVVYLIFNEGYTATSGEEWMRAALSEEALRLGRMLAQLLPDESEVHALLALMELQSSRTAARRGKDGEAVLLPDQDRSLWDHAQIQRGTASLEHGQRLGGCAKSYPLQAIAACHGRAPTVQDTAWDRIVR